MIHVGILTASDKGAAGQRTDESSKVIAEMIQSIHGKVHHYAMVPDEKEVIAASLRHMVDELQCHLVFTTGGTGFSPRDVTPEATLSVIEKQAPGIPEAMRQKSLEITPRAMLSRAVAGIRGQSLIINLPGSPKGVRECLQVILPVLPHGLEILAGSTGECAR